jgi:photosystem II stability/assembly factor-like uncharacterized protein
MPGLLPIVLAVSSVASAQSPVSRLFAATSEGPFVSYSWGEHWSRIRPELRGFTGAIEDFLCLGPWVFTGGSDGLFLSEDFGENYRAVAAWPKGAPPITSFLAGKLFPLEPTVFVGTTAGLYRVKGSGSKWTRIGESAIQSAVRAMSWPGPLLYVATDAGLFRTGDSGDSFERIGAGLPEEPLLSLALSRFFPLETIVFVGTAGSGLYKSEDAGDRFESVGTGLLGKETVHAVVWWGGLLLVGTDRGLFLSEDAGKEWEQAAEFRGRRVLAIEVPGLDADMASDVIVGTDLGVYKSSDGAKTFRRVQEGMGAIEVRALATFPIYPENSIR